MQDASKTLSAGRVIRADMEARTVLSMSVLRHTPQPPVRMIKLTEQREITPCKCVS